jgi:phosphatidate cytidylyltransferase
MAAISNFWQRILTGTIFLLIMIGSIVASFQSFLILFGIIAILATYEYIKITSLFASPNKILIYILNITAYFLVAFVLFVDIDTLSNHGPGFRMIKILVTNRLFVFMLILFPALIIASEIFRKTEKPFDNIGFGVLGFIYIAVPFILLIQTFSPVIGTYNFRGPLAYFLLLWSTDSFAYVWGKLLGRHKLAPHISEGKTIEGTIGGILTTMAFSISFHFIFPEVGYSITQWIIYAFLIAVFAIPSDLSESLLKRRAGIKDSGKILPGHGGILDRFDSVLLTAPVIYIYTSIINHL